MAGTTIAANDGYQLQMPGDGLSSPNEIIPRHNFTNSQKTFTQDSMARLRSIGDEPAKEPVRDQT
jgi:hypothetical protein